MAGTEIDLDDLIAAIVASIDAAFPTFATVEAYREDRKELALPACLVTLSDFEAFDDPGTEQLALTTRFEVHVILGFRTSASRRAAPKLAAAVAHHINGSRWGQPVSPAVVSVIEPDDFAPELDEFEVWRIDWSQVVHVGASVWVDDGTLPTEVWGGWAPDIGPPNVGDYELIVSAPPEVDP